MVRNLPCIINFLFFVLLCRRRTHLAHTFNSHRKNFIKRYAHYLLLKKQLTTRTLQPALDASGVPSEIFHLLHLLLRYPHIQNRSSLKEQQNGLVPAGNQTILIILWSLIYYNIKVCQLNIESISRGFCQYQQILLHFSRDIQKTGFTQQGEFQITNYWEPFTLVRMKLQHKCDVSSNLNRC